MQLSIPLPDSHRSIYLMFGRQAKLPLDIVYGSAPTEAELYHQYARKLKQTFERAYSTAREHVGTAVERAKEIYTMHGACMGFMGICLRQVI